MSAQPIRIGYGLSLTGPPASNGNAARLAHQFWAQDVNSKGGLLGRKVELICIDGETNPKFVRGICQRRLDDEKVDLLIGGYGHNSLSPAMPLVMERSRYLVALIVLAVNASLDYPSYFLMISTGPQICLNTRRTIAQRKIADEFLEKFAAQKTLPKGDPHGHKTIIGPLITPAAVKLCDDRVKEAFTKGAKLHTGGVIEGNIYHPTIVSNVLLDVAVANEETFVPGVVVEIVDIPEEAVEAAMYRLTSSTLAGNTYKAFELAPKILAGIVNVNSSTVNDEIHAPMGGGRDGGWGRVDPESLKDLIWINSHGGQRQYPI